eukprot:GHVQ01035272.1.p2 GENE.GHVQ01035272.1~~GHVQ01035272.1.p2  ORF type:complete len:205 (+),score=31.87 GHVQ01035272.1:218-832(+)
MATTRPCQRILLRILRMLCWTIVFDGCLLVQEHSNKLSHDKYKSFASAEEQQHLSLRAAGNLLNDNLALAGGSSVGEIDATTLNNDITHDDAVSQSPMHFFPTSNALEVRRLLGDKWNLTEIADNLTNLRDTWPEDYRKIPKLSLTTKTEKMLELQEAKYEPLYDLVKQYRFQVVGAPIDFDSRIKEIKKEYDAMDASSFVPVF